MTSQHSFAGARDEQRAAPESESSTQALDIVQARAAQRSRVGQADDIRSARASVQRAGGGEDSAAVHEAAARGTAGSGGALPHLDAIQRSFGHHDVSGVQAHVGGEAAEASAAMGAEAYATGNDVAFGGAPSLHTAAHEAAHVVQQRGGVSLKGGVGQVGDPYERHADAVADRVVQGESAVDLLDQMAGGGGAGGVQSKAAPGGDEAGGPAGGDVMADAQRVVDKLEALIAGVEGSAGGQPGGATAPTPAAPTPAAATPAAPASAGGEVGIEADATTGTDEAAPGAPPPELARAKETLARFTDLMSAGESDELRAAIGALLPALEDGPTGGASAGPESPGPTSAPGAPVQRTAAAAAPLVCGPGVWVCAGVLAIGTLLLYKLSQTKTTSIPRVMPRVVPRTKPKRPLHRGRLQVQGGDLRAEVSFPWARSVPMTKAEATAALIGLRAGLGRRELGLRDQAFARALAFIASTLVTAPPPISRTFQNRNLPSNRRDARVDIEIRTGMAFV